MLTRNRSLVALGFWIPLCAAWLLWPSAAAGLRTPAPLERLEAEDVEALETLATYPEDLREAALRASLHTDLLVEMERLQDRSSEAFHDRIEALEPELQEQVWELVRVPGLLSELGGGEPLTDAELEALAASNPDQEAAIWTFGRLHHPLLVELLDIHRGARARFEEMTEELPEADREAFYTLVEEPELVSILTTRVRLAVLLGESYVTDPEGTRAHLAALAADVETRNLAAAEDWKRTIEEDPEARAELEAATEVYEEECGCEVETYTETTVVRVVHPYPYWFGYPVHAVHYYDVYPYGYWYPYYGHAYYHHTGFYLGFWLPPVHFVHWFYGGGHHHRYGHLHRRFDRHHRSHPHARSASHRVVRRWERVADRGHHGDWHRSGKHARHGDWHRRGEYRDWDRRGKHGDRRERAFFAQRPQKLDGARERGDWRQRFDRERDWRRERFRQGDRDTRRERADRPGRDTRRERAELRRGERRERVVSRRDARGERVEDRREARNDRVGDRREAREERVEDRREARAAQGPRDRRAERDRRGPRESAFLAPDRGARDRVDRGDRDRSARGRDGEVRNPARERAERQLRERAERRSESRSANRERSALRGDRAPGSERIERAPRADRRETRSERRDVRIDRREARGERRDVRTRSPKADRRGDGGSRGPRAAAIERRGPSVERAPAPRAPERAARGGGPASRERSARAPRGGRAERSYQGGRGRGGRANGGMQGRGGPGGRGR